MEDEEEIMEDEEESSAVDTSVPPELAAQTRSFRNLVPKLLEGQIIAATPQQTKSLQGIARNIEKRLKKYESGSSKVNVPKLIEVMRGFNARLDSIRNTPELPQGKKRKRKTPVRFEDEHSVSLEHSAEAMVDILQEKLDIIYNAYPNLCERHPETREIYNTIGFAIEQAADNPNDAKLLKAISEDTDRLQSLIINLSDEVHRQYSQEDDDDEEEEADSDDMSIEDDDDDDGSYAFDEANRQLAEARTQIDLFKRGIAETRQIIPRANYLTEKENKLVVTKLGRLMLQTEEKHVESLSKIRANLAKRAKKKRRPNVIGYVVQFLNLETLEWYDYMPMNGVTVAPIYIDKENAEALAEVARRDIVRKVYPDQNPPEVVRIVKVKR